MNSITATDLGYTWDTKVWPTHYFEFEPYVETSQINADLPASELLAHESWVMDGVDDIDRTNPVDTLLAAWREEGIFTATDWSFTSAAKDYVSSCIRRKRWMLAHVPAVGTLLTIVGDETCHYLPVGTQVVVTGTTPSGTTHHPVSVSRDGYGRRPGRRGASFYVKRALQDDGTPTDERWAHLIVAERDVAPWWQPLPKAGDLVNWHPSDGETFGEPGPFAVHDVDLSDYSFRIKANSDPNRMRWIFPRGYDTRVGALAWSPFTDDEPVVETVPTDYVEAPTVPLAHVAEAMAIIGEVYNRAADQRNWCSEADQVTRQVNAALNRAGLNDVFQLVTRETDISGYVEVNIVVPVRLRITDVTVSLGATEAEQEAAIREAFEQDGRSALEVVDDYASWQRADVDWEDGVVQNANVYVD
jgi:hypothetical protein